MNVTSRTDNDGSVTSFGYDGANQLTSEVRTGPGAYSVSYLYDNNGNRTQKTLNGVPELYTYGPNDRILTAGARSYVTDSNGNITSVTVGGLTTALSYDFENQLTRIDFPGGAFNVFKYNGLGLRVFTQDSRGNTAYVTDGMEAASPVMLDSAATYTPGVSERRGAVSKFYHPDHLGSTRGITNSSQAATDAMLHDAFGTLVSRTGTTPTPFGYVGQEQYQSDVDSGLMLLGHRYYDPYTGRFITQDPIGAEDNWYGYVGNDPQNWVDPKGLQRNSDTGGGPPVQTLRKLADSIENHRREIHTRIGELQENPILKNLPETHPNDDRKPSLSKRGHRRMIEDHKAELGKDWSKLRTGIKQRFGKDIGPQPKTPSFGSHRPAAPPRRGGGRLRGGNLFSIFVDWWIGVTVEAGEESMRQTFTRPGNGT